MRYLFIFLFLSIHCAALWAQLPEITSSPSPFPFTYSLSGQFTFKEVSSNVITFTHPVATVSISIKSVQSPLTASAYSALRARTQFDRWTPEFERVGHAQETLRANADSSYVSLYSQEVLNSKLEVKKRIIGEYVFVKDTRVLLCSVDTLQDQWPQLQDDFKTLLDSLSFNQLSQQSSEKASIKKKLSLRPAKFDINSKIVWEQDLGPAFTNGALSSNGMWVAAAVDKWLYVLNAQTGALQWHAKYPGSVQAVFCSESELYVVFNDKSMSWFMAYDSLGKVLLKKALSFGFKWSLTCKDSLLILNSETNLIAMDTSTKQVLWNLKGQYYPNFLPLISSEAVFVYDTVGQFTAYQPSNGAVKWTVPFSVFTAPVLINDFTVLLAGGTPLSMKMVNASTGETMAKAPLPLEHLTYPPVVVGEKVWVFGYKKTPQLLSFSWLDLKQTGQHGLGVSVLPGFVQGYSNGFLAFAPDTYFQTLVFVETPGFLVKYIQKSEKYLQTQVSSTLTGLFILAKSDKGSYLKFFSSK